MEVGRMTNGRRGQYPIYGTKSSSRSVERSMAALPDLSCDREVRGVRALARESSGTRQGAHGQLGRLRGAG